MQRMVDISLAGDDITISPTILHVDSGDTIEWHATGGVEFMAVFRDGGVKDKATSGPEVRSKGGDATGIASGPSGTHSYQLAVWEKSNNKLHMDTGCPEVIIR